MQSKSYTTDGGVKIERRIVLGAYSPADTTLAEALDKKRGVLFSSSFEFPGRYTRWDMGFVDPPLVFTARDRNFSVEALNPRGEVLIAPIAAALCELDAVELGTESATRITGTIRPTTTRFPEEQRSRQPSVFSVLRALIALFKSAEDEHLGFYGAFGYDLVFQFEPMQLRLPRLDDQRDLVLYLPDEILIVDHMRQQAAVHRYEFSTGGKSTADLPRGTPEAAYRSDLIPTALPPESDHAPGEYPALVEKAKEAFKRGDLFEVVPGQLLTRPSPDQPSVVFERLKKANPAPYGALINLGAGEFLVSASPEMYVRVEGRRIETCPISGTIRRGADPIEDADRILELLNSKKDESELTMCTDVDRNDKSRVCAAGSVRVIGRRQIEMYSRLIHTVDHVEGTLRPEFDALDGFLSHAWAVTVTGAPKLWAIRFIEEHERSARRWYGGAIGRLTFDGNMNTGLTLRTIRMKDGLGEVRAGATLLFDSDPVGEDEECRLKASALFAAIAGNRAPAQPTAPATPQSGVGRKVLLVDHEDSFVHTLAGYVRQTGAECVTLRHDFARAELANGGPAPDLVLLSPGPGRPNDFAMQDTLDLILKRGIPVFGVCLGLQGIVEYFGGNLDVLDTPMHGKPSVIRASGNRLFGGLPNEFTVGRYHSLYARKSTLPAELSIAAETNDGVIMAIEHRTLPIAAVQFHPESIMTPPNGIGMPIITAMLSTLCAEPTR
ncbi:MAG TPA: anthranilate synthase component I [Stellaceae bacterium]|nr:anthranilate synthase component I [Stellaceae bacterium]